MAEVYKSLTDYIELLKEDKFGEWIVDRENDGSMEYPIHFSFVSYSDMVNHFTKEIYDFEQFHPEYEMTKYGETLEKNGIDWGTKQMEAADVSELDAKAVMALLMGAVRAERFCDGASLHR